MKLQLSSGVPRRRDLIGLALLSLCVLVLVWLVRDRQSTPQTTRAPRPPTTKDPLLQSDLRGLPELVRGRYRIAPDKRLGIALVALQRLSTGTRSAPVQMRFRDRGWDVLLGPAQAGRLPEIPTFADSTALLVGWAKAHPLPAARGAAGVPAAIPQRLSTAIEALDPQAILEGLHALDAALTRERVDPAAISTAARGFAWLSLFTVDRLEQADAVFGRAWALLALESSLGSSSIAEHETLVASSLGYEAAAAEAARGLAEGDPLRLYAAKDLARLSRVCGERPQDRLCRYFELALLAERDNRTAFERALDGSPFAQREPLPVLGLISRADGRGALRSAGLAGLALASAEQKVPSRTIPPPRHIEARSGRLERAAQERGRALGGELLDADSVTSFYRAVFYSGLLTEAVYALDFVGSAEAARQLAAAIEDPAPGTAAQLRRWIEVRAGTLDNTATVAGLQSAIRELDQIGGLAASDLADGYRRLSPALDFARRAPFPAVFARLDSRPAHLHIGAWVSHNLLASPYLHETYLRSAALAAPHLRPDGTALIAWMDEDAMRLRAIVEDPAMPLSGKHAALWHLEELGSDKRFVRSRYEAISREAEAGWTPLGEYLELTGDLDGALAALRSTLAGYSAGEDLDWAHLKTSEARVLRNLGRLDEAMVAIAPAVGSWKGEVLLEAATIEYERGNVEAGLVHARNALERYPDSSRAAALVARGRWMRRDFATAAKELAATKNPVTSDWNARLPQAFADTFAKGPEGEAARALQVLAAAKIAPHVLAQLAGEWGRRGHAAAALRLIGTLRDPEPEWQAEILYVGYDLLRETAGEAAALAWVEKGTWARSHQEAIILLQTRRCALLLARFPPPLTDGHRPVRVMLAAGLLQLGETSGPRWDSLLQAAEQDRVAGSYYGDLTLLMLGKEDVTAVAPQITNMLGVESTAWALGMRAAYEGRAEEADGWFQVALEANRENEPPHAWAYSILTDWIGRWRSLAVLQRRGALLKPPVERRGEKRVLGANV